MKNEDTNRCVKIIHLDELSRNGIRFLYVFDSVRCYTPRYMFEKV